MSDAAIRDAMACVVFLWFLYIVWEVWVWPIFRDRPRPVRKDAPTEGPWIQPEPKYHDDWGEAS